MPWIKGQLLWVRPGREPEGAVFVVRKALGTAVVRNRLKRRLRHLYREQAARPGSLVVLAQGPAARSTYASLRQELCSLLARLQP